MRGKTETEAENVCHVFLRERSSVPLRESGEVRRRFFEKASDRSMTFPVQAVARSAVAFEGLSARWDIEGGWFRFLDRRTARRTNYSRDETRKEKQQNNN